MSYTEESLSYEDFEKLYNSGRITREQLRPGALNVPELRAILNELEEEKSMKDGAYVDVQRDDVSRYSRDFEVNGVQPTRSIAQRVNSVEEEVSTGTSTGTGVMY